MTFREVMTALRCPRFADLPDLPLYMDQVIAVLEKQLSPFALYPDEKLLTPTMINNYVKQRLIPPPEKKRYTRKHLAMLFICTLLKQVISLSDLDRALRAYGEAADIGQIYDRFCEELQTALRAVFGSGSYMLVQSEQQEQNLLRNATAAYAFQLYTRYLIAERAPLSADAIEAEKQKPEKKKKRQKQNEVEEEAK